MFDVCALGEILIDFTQVGVSDAGNAVYERNPGGAPCNVLTAVARLGGKSAFIGTAGNDILGLFKKKTLHENDINDKGLFLSLEANTTIAFVSVDETGDRSFDFYRN